MLIKLWIAFLKFKNMTSCCTSDKNGVSIRCIFMLLYEESHHTYLILAQIDLGRGLDVQLV